MIKSTAMRIIATMKNHHSDLFPGKSKIILITVEDQIIYYIVDLMPLIKKNTVLRKEILSKHLGEP